MLTCRPTELLGTSWVLLAGLLVPLQQAAEILEPLTSKVAAVGSPVLLPGLGNITQVYSMQWEYLNGTSSHTILQYYRGSHSPAIHASYTGRAVFHPSNGSLLLEGVQESDSGIYKATVNMGDRESLKILLEVLSLSPPLQDVLRIAVVAVVFAAVSAGGLIIPICQSEKLRIRGELWRWLSAYTCGLVCIASILAGTAGGLWMREEGPSVAIILPEIALTYIMVVTFLVSTTVTFQPTNLTQLKSKAAQRTMGYAAPGGVVVVVLMTSFLIKNIHHRHEEGCTDFMDVTILTVSTAAVSALPLLAIFLCYHTTQGRLKERDTRWADMERSFEMSQRSSKDALSTH
ncbi:uncharacterized protein LOC130596844 isoform X3 [Pezoporus wallicus]|uniref:uncharacterized protein LOC130596844 isoform X3 n=1 Tax=Pezoporus wallicus TaxID=35540 RepID=UPI00254E2EB5|nr:uncharacterized protein LOC130596844 isoform X3 [Pezoporus wallicus]XP_061301595.1 uncharacterized protein LOC133265272 isoform X4 [Pezoporus flaviventris]